MSLPHPRQEQYSPCICPIISSLSNLSVPASSNNFAPLAPKNFPLIPLNQFSQYASVRLKSVRHPHDPSSLLNSKLGTLALALSAFRSVRDRTCHSTAASTDANSA